MQRGLFGIVVRMAALSIGPAAGVAMAQTTPAVATAAATQPALRLGLATNTHLTYEPAPWRAPDTPWSDPTRPPPQQRVGLEFKASPNNGPSPRGLLKVQLSGDSVLHFKPRSGGMVVTYRSQF